MLQSNFLEGMACVGGCIGGAGTLQKFGIKKENVDNYAKSSTIQDISESVSRKNI